MDRRLHLASIGWRIATAGGGVVGAMYFDHFALVVFHDALRRDEVAIPQPNLASGRQPEIFWRRHFAEVILLDIKFARERHLARACALILRIILRVHLFDLALVDLAL